MADYTITAAQVLLDSGTPKDAIAGVALLAGQSIYLDASDSNKAKLADANGATSPLQVCVGICLNRAEAAGQPIRYADNGVITMASSAVTGAFAYDAVILSATPGGLAPHADATTGWRENIIGFWDATKTKITLNLIRAADVRGA